MPQVIAHFLDGPRGDFRQAFVSTACQRVQQIDVKGFEQESPDDQVAEVSVRLLHEQQVAIFVLAPQEREVVLGTPMPLALPGVGIEQARLANEIQCEIGVREFLLELRTGSNQFDHALPEHQRVVAETRRVSRQECLVGHRFSTSSGMS